MARRTRAQWHALIEAHAASGQTAAICSRERGINAKYFSVRRRQLSGEREASISSFIPVSFDQSNPVEKFIVRHIIGASIELPLAIEARWLAQLLRALRD